MAKYQTPITAYDAICKLISDACDNPNNAHKSKLQLKQEVLANPICTANVKLFKTIWKYRDINNFPEYARKYLKIRTKDRRIINFELNRAQSRVFSLIQEKVRKREVPRFYILKARQLGFSTLIEALGYYICKFRCNTNALLVAHDKEKASEIFHMTKLFYETTPKILKPAKKRSNKLELYFSNPKEDDEVNIGLKSIIKVDTASSSHLGAGSTIQFIHKSEYARWDEVNPDIKDVLATLAPAIPKIPEVFDFIETTARGSGIGKEDWDADNGYEHIFVSWLADDKYRAPFKVKLSELSSKQESEFGDELEVRRHIITQLKYWYPEYKGNNEWYETESLHRLAWRRLVITEDFKGDLFKFSREYPSYPEEAFLTSGSNLFNTYALNNLREKSSSIDRIYFRYVKPSTQDVDDLGFFEFDPHGDLTVFELPQQGKEYYLGADIAAGIRGRDYSVLQVVDNEKQVAVYRTYDEPDDLALVARYLATRYNRAKIIPESNSYGLTFIIRLTKVLKYPRVFLRKELDSVEQRVMMKYGIYMSSRTKPVILQQLRTAINEGFKIFDEVTINELLGFIVNDKGKSVSLTDHDDTVMSLALAIAGWPRNRNLFGEIEENNEPPMYSMYWWLQRQENIERSKLLC